jgi:ribosomal protein S1
MTTKQSISMDDLLAESSVDKIIPGDIVQGEVLSVRKHELLVDLGQRGIE